MLRNGQTFGSYRIQSLLGRGAMGMVYQGIGLHDGEPVAIKTLRSELLTGPERDAILARFRREAQIGMRLKHPCIVRVRDFGEQDEVLYLAMDFITGQELGKLLEKTPKLPLAMSLALMLQLLNALAYAHAKGVIHRDIKPANIMVRPDYTVALTDFGIAHVGGSELTQTGDLLGSPLYMAPEQLRGEPVDHRADLFAAGVVLYYLLTHRKPFDADSLAALMHRILYEDPPPISTANQELPATFDPVLRQALAKDRQTRFATSLEFAAALRQARTASLGTPVVSTISRPSKPVVETSASTVWQRLQQLYGNETLTNLAEIILRDAPLPGRVLRDARGDWLERVRLFTQRHSKECQTGDGRAADMARNRLIQELTGAFLDYAGILNQRLFSEDNPQLLQISADFARLDLLRLALEEMNAEGEARRVEQTQLLFASQVMGKVNSLIRQFLDSRDPLARFEVASLLIEVEELIVLAERLLESSETTMMMDAATPGGSVLAEFVTNAYRLGQILGQELQEQVQAESESASAEDDHDAGQGLFMGRLRQLGLLYRFAARMESGEQTGALRLLATEMHGMLDTLTNQLLTTMRTLSDVQESARAEQCLIRLSAIAELAEQFVWPELHQRILSAIRSQIFPARPSAPVDHAGFHARITRNP